MSSSNPGTQGSQVTKKSDNGDIIQASTTVASLAVAVVALPTTLGSRVVFTMGKWTITLGPLLLLCGLFALVSSIKAVDMIRREEGLTASSLLMSKTHFHLTCLFWALMLFILIYVGIISSM